MPLKAETGQVFGIPLGANRYGVGQVVDASTKELYIVGYDAIAEGPPNDATIVLGKAPLLSALSLDAKIWNGDWPIVGVFLANLPTIAQPVYKLEYQGSVFLESRDRRVFRQALPGEPEKLRYRSVVAPVRFESALRAHHGLDVWHPKYDELLYDYALASSKLTPS